MKLKIKYLHSLKGRSIIVRSLRTVKRKSERIKDSQPRTMPDIKDDMDAWRPEPDYLRVKNGEAESPYLDERA